MVDEEFLKRMKVLGVKSLTMSSDGERVISVEFFSSIPALDLDTLVPPPGDEPSGIEPVPSAIARILQKGSVS